MRYFSHVPKNVFSKNRIKEFDLIRMAQMVSDGRAADCPGSNLGVYSKFKLLFLSVCSSAAYVMAIRFRG